MGVNTPHLLDLDLENCILIIEYLPFPPMKDVLGTNEAAVTERDEDEEGQVKTKLVKEVGRLVGVLHANDIVHGDLTTSNILVDTEKDEVHFIDFGLAEKTAEIENKGVDLHVFAEAFESTHSSLMSLLDDFHDGYREGNPDEGEDVIIRAREIAKRGRYS